LEGRIQGDYRFCRGSLGQLCSAQDAKPAVLKLGITTFTSGPASVFGAPAKSAAELWIEEFNAAGGFNGVKLVPTFIDEGLGGDKFLSEYRRVAQESGEKVMLSAISSGNCGTVAPVAEDLKVINIMWDCGTEKVLEDRPYKYVVRTQANAVTEMVATVVYLLKVKPDFKTIAVVNQDYAWGRDSWEIFKNAMLALKPDAKVVAELFPKFGATDFSTEVSRLQALKPEVILSTSWGGDLDTFIRQASRRGLTRNSQFVLPLAESSLERLGSASARQRHHRGTWRPLLSPSRNERRPQTQGVRREIPGSNQNLSNLPRIPHGCGARGVSGWIRRSY
jgi:branched-chain amino acid transport system substrate-binding protein